MATRPFFAVVNIPLTADGEGQGEYDVGGGNTLIIKRIYHKSTGSFDILNISDTFGNRYTNATSSEPLPQNIFPDLDTDNNNEPNLTDFIEIKQNSSIQFNVKDTSSSGNTVVFVLQGLLQN